ncbi:MAG: V-type ATP synthase subunit A, partial [Gammaproteobacteria bacterium]|nr:V-type ATP synthase subunit A [Gammaproteobacteria bacterium]
MNKAEVFWINGPVLKARPVGSLQMKEAVFVGDQRLAAEVIRLDHDAATVQVFEDTTGLKPGTQVYGSGLPLAAELGPGMLGCIFDGIQRPLVEIAHRAGDFFDAGVNVAALNRERLWNFQPSLEPGAAVREGQTLGLVPESADLSHRVLIPPGVTGELEWIVEAGEYTVEDIVARVRTRDGSVDVSMLRRWPIRKSRPCASRLSLTAPLLTGQRAIDTFFPIAKGGAASLPGGFGTGKTVLLQTVAKWSDADVIVYIGCGERG